MGVGEAAVPPRVGPSTTCQNLSLEAQRAKFPMLQFQPFYVLICLDFIWQGVDGSRQLEV